jgi:hypothetical protein
METYYHGTNQEITKIEAYRIFEFSFDDFLFFSNLYRVAESHGEIVYSLEIDDKEIEHHCNSWFYSHYDLDKEIDWQQLFKDELEEIQERLNCDEDEAEDFLSENRSDVNNFVDAEDAAEISWRIQCLTARAAKKLGFRGVAVRDEHGTSYMIAMQNKEHELVKL